jgi:hypothetical protein
MQEWSYTRNPFEYVTRNNYKKLFLLATDHFDKLTQAAKNNLVIDELFRFGQPTYQAFRQAHQDYMTESAMYRMNTQAFKDQLGILKIQLIRQWDIRIQMEFDRGTPKYLSLLPRVRQPFHKGAYELIINEVLALSDKLAPYPALSSLRTEVAEFGQNLLNLRTIQQGQEAKIKQCAHLLETRRQELLQVMHYIWAGLIQLHYRQPEAVKQYYDLSYLQRKA